MRGCIRVCVVLYAAHGAMPGERGSRQHTCSRSVVPTARGGRSGRSWSKKKKKKPQSIVKARSLTESVFVCLPGCQIKEFLCVGGSDRVYLTLQLLLCSKCPTVNAGHESHLALDRGSLFSGERGSCLEKILEGVYVRARGGGVCALCCVQTYSGALSLTPTIDGILRREGKWTLLGRKLGSFGGQLPLP